jgi:DNA polymerase sigma
MLERFCVMRGIHGAPQGFTNSQGLIVMVAQYCATHQPIASEDISGWDLVKIFIDTLDFYGNRFAFQNCGITTNATFDRNPKGWADLSCPAIEDPVNSSKLSLLPFSSSLD